MPYPASTIPLDYTTPSFPSLYWPIRAPPGAAQYLYSTTDIWRFTLYWTLITFGLVHGAVATWAVLMQFHSAYALRAALRRSSSSSKGKGNGDGSGDRKDHSDTGRKKQVTKKENTRSSSKRVSILHHHRDANLGVDEITEGIDDKSTGFGVDAPSATRSNDPRPRRTTGSGDVGENNVDTDADDDENDLNSTFSSPSSPTHHHIFPQPLLVSSRPVLSTLGWVWLIPVVYLAVGGLEAILSGSLVGLVIGAVYNAGYFKMSTWMPFLWGIINCLIVILGSFRIQGGL